MTNENILYEMPNVGCMMGAAYQTLVRHLANELQKAGLKITPSEYLIIRSLYTRDGMQQCEIADMIGKDKGAISRGVSSLLKKGLVTTECVSHKCIRVYISETGRKIETQVMGVADRCHATLCSNITFAQGTALVEILRKIIYSNFI